ncbi:MAG: transposase [Hyphomonadaceae bacterium]|nr:transposase [Hyphomonadaceae bacterium]
MQKTLQTFLQTNDERVSRLEILEGPTGRRKWPDEVKARIVAKTLVAGPRVREVADRHGVAPQYLTTWRRLAREGQFALPADGSAPFAACGWRRAAQWPAACAGLHRDGGRGRPWCASRRMCHLRGSAISQRCCAGDVPSGAEHKDHGGSEARRQITVQAGLPAPRSRNSAQAYAFNLQCLK